MKLRIFKRWMGYVLFHCTIMTCVTIVTAQNAEKENEPENLFERNFLQEDNSPFSLDVRLVPEYEQINQAIIKNNNLSEQDIFYQTNNTFSMNLQNFQLKIDSTTIYDLMEVTADEDLEEYQAQEFGGLILLHISILNTSNYPIKFPQDALVISGGQDAMPTLSNPGLYPLEMGGLDQVLEASENIILPEQSLEGYLAFGINSLDFQIIQWKGYFDLVLTESAIPLRFSSGANLEDNEITIPTHLANHKNQLLVLPVTSDIEEELINKENFLTSRLTSEWWGSMNLIASEKLNIGDSQQMLGIKLSEIELVDFAERDEFKKYFEEFSQGQLVLTSKISLKNQSSSLLVMSNEEINARIKLANRHIEMENKLATEQNNMFMMPGDEGTYSFVFIIDREMYQKLWQDIPISLEVFIEPQLLSLNIKKLLGLFKWENSIDINTWDIFSWLELALDSQFEEKVVTFEYSWIPEDKYSLSENFEWFLTQP